MTGKKPLVSTAQLQKTAYAIAIVLALGFAYVGLGGQVPQFFASTPSGVGAAAAQIQSQGAVCSAADKTPSTLKYLAQYKDVSTNTETPVNTTVVAYNGVGAQIDAATLFTSTTGAAGYTSLGSVTCGDEVTSYIGDGGATYYYSIATNNASTTVKDSTLIKAELMKASAVTVSFQNSSSGNWGATVGQAGVTSGQQGFNSVTMQIQAGQYYYGDGAFEVCAQYATSNISKVSFGASATGIDQDKSLSVAAGTDTNCYEVNTQLFGSNKVTLPVVIDAASGVLPSNSSIRVYVNDATFRIKNGVPADRYFNKDTKADLGFAAVNTAGAIVVN